MSYKPIDKIKIILNRIPYVVYIFEEIRENEATIYYAKINKDNDESRLNNYYGDNYLGLDNKIVYYYDKDKFIEALNDALRTGERLISQVNYY